MVKRYLSLLIVSFIIALFPNPVGAYEFNYKVNAMYIYYFTKYINWPALPGAGTITIGILGDSPVLDQLKIVIATRKMDTRLIIARRIEFSEMNKCQMVVISKSQNSALKRIKEATKNLPILIVTEKSGLTSKGSDISIYIDDEDNFKTKLEISILNLEKRNLKIANELVAMAEVVK